MSAGDPLQKTRSDYDALIEKLSSPKSPVGIDAQYTHAVIIEYLQQIMERLEALEAKLEEKR